MNFVFFSVLSGRMTREQFANVMMSMSSAGGESLQEIWKMLDEDGISPRITPMNTVEGRSKGFTYNDYDVAIAM